MQYVDFELKIERGSDGYVARVLRSPAGEASCAFTLPFSEDRLDLLVLKLGRVRRGTRSLYSEETEAARELGGKLFESVFGGEIRGTLRSSLDQAGRGDDTGLRLKLRLQDVPELADLPWEFLFDASLDRFFAQSNQTPIVRYLEMPERIKPLAVRLPLQILAMISSPLDPNYARLDVEREEAMLRQALGPLLKDGRVRIDWMEDATLANLQRRLRGGEYHIFHFIGHGGFDKATEEGVLLLEDEQDRGWPAGARRIGTLLHDHRSLRLAVLNACEGARNSRQDPFGGVATTLVRAGVPAVVAMQFEITDGAAITFAGEFYTALAEGYPVDAAVAEARKAVYAQPNDVEWGTPVLYLRAPDGVLFDVQAGLWPLDPQPVVPDMPPPAPVRRVEDPEPPKPPDKTPAKSALEGLVQAALTTTLGQGHTVQIDADGTQIRQRLTAWAKATGFTSITESDTTWKFERGNRLAGFYTLDIAKRFMEVTVQSDGHRPAMIAIEYRGVGGGLLFATRDRTYLTEQIRVLVAYLQGARR
jgi:hypothetical protein